MSTMNWQEHVTKSQRRSGLPELHPGDQIRVWCRIQEQDRVRLSPFEGLVIRRRGGSSVSATVTVRRVTYGEGVERVFPIHAPVLDRIEILRRGNVRRSRLYFLRQKVGKTRIAAANEGAGASTRTSKSSSSGEERTAAAPTPPQASEPSSATVSS